MEHVETQLFSARYATAEETLTNEVSCNDSDEEFPLIFSATQLNNGYIVFCFLIGIYSFTLLAIICDKYFLPCVLRICEVAKDVAAATFMSMATSAPELFVNIVGTFITKSDIGIGTVIGSNIYNTLGVSALGSLAASAPIQLDWWPVTRDCVLYVMTIALVVGLTWDGDIYWYTSIVMVLSFLVFLIIQFNNNRILRIIRKCLKKKENPDVENDSRKVSQITAVVHLDHVIKEHSEGVDEELPERVSDFKDLFRIPIGRWWSVVFFCYSWPIRLILFCTVPNPESFPRLFPVTFLMCIVWIGVNSYIVSWMLTLIGSTLGISDSILGLTLLAAGGGLPESISIIIMSRKGEGSIGVSNALGANTTNILMSLGLPWFIKTMMLGAHKDSYVKIESGSIHFTILALLIVTSVLYIILYLNKFRLSRRIGVILCIVYVTFISLAVLSEYFFERASGIC